MKEKFSEEQLVKMRKQIRQFPDEYQNFLNNLKDDVDIHKLVTAGKIDLVLAKHTFWLKPIGDLILEEYVAHESNPKLKQELAEVRQYWNDHHKDIASQVHSVSSRNYEEQHEQFK